LGAFCKKITKTPQRLYSGPNIAIGGFVKKNYNPPRKKIGPTALKRIIDSLGPARLARRPGSPNPPHVWGRARAKMCIGGPGRARTSQRAGPGPFKPLLISHNTVKLKYLACTSNWCSI